MDVAGVKAGDWVVWRSHHDGVRMVRDVDSADVAAQRGPCMRFRGKWLSPQRSGIQKQELLAQSGLVIVMNKCMKPSYRKRKELIFL